MLDGIISYVECNKEYIYEGGDHSIFVGRVINLKILSDEKPLLYYKGEYNKIG